MNEDLIYLYRRKGYESWATCDADRYSELAGNHFFEVRVARHQHDYAALEAECERLARVATLQPDANSWQSGYDKGREDGARAADGWKTQHARDSAELRRLCSERDALHAEVEALLAENGRLRADYDNAAEDAMDAAREANRLRAEVEALRAENARFESDFKRLGLQYLGALTAQQAATVAIEPKPLDVIGYASPGQVEILRSLPRTGGMKVKGRKDDRYSEPVVLLKDARAALISLAARCQQEGAFKVCLECGYQDGHDEICQFHATNRKQGQSSHVSVSRELLEKVCDPKSSTNRQEGRKSIRTLLKGRDPAGQYNHKRIGWELERTALGDGYYGNALRVAKDIPGLTDQDRAVLDRYATGAQQGTDHIALQDIAMRVYAAPEHVARHCST